MNENVTSRNTSANDEKVRETREKINKSINKSKAKKALPIAGATLLTIGVIVGLSVIAGAYYLLGDKQHMKDLHLDQESIMKTFNEKKSEYSLKFNHFFQGMSLNQIRTMFMPSLSHGKLEPKCDISSLQNVKVPEQYNFYKEHKKCRFDEIDQRSVNGYVEVLVSTIKSRYCAAGHKEIEPSVDFLLACDKDKHGSKAGFLTKVLEDSKKTGIVTEKCWASLHKSGDKCLSNDDIKKCDRVEVADFCFLTNPLNIKQEIAKNGPVISVIEPYLDFLLFDKGVYHFNKSKKIEGKVFVKIVGWGKDKQTEYWLVETTWGKKWAESGLAKVKMNEHGSFLDNTAVAVYPRLHSIKDDTKSK